MRPEEMPIVVEYLGAAWPYPLLTEAELQVWRETLAGVAQEDALAALRLLRLTEQWRPGHAKFTETARGLAAQRLDGERQQNAERWGLADGSGRRADRDTSLRWLRQIRASRDAWADRDQEILGREGR